MEGNRGYVPQPNSSTAQQIRYWPYVLSPARRRFEAAYMMFQANPSAMNVHEMRSALDELADESVRKEL